MNFLVMNDQHAAYLDFFVIHLDVCSFDVSYSKGTRKYRQTRLVLDKKTAEWGKLIFSMHDVVF